MDSDVSETVGVVVDISGSVTGMDAGSSERVVGEVEEFLRDAISQMEPDLVEWEREGPGRPRILPSLALWAGLLVCVLRGFSSQLDLWRLLSKGNFWFYPRFPISDQAVYKRLEQAGSGAMESLFGWVTQVLRERLEPFVAHDLAPFAREVVVLDETTLDPVARMLPALREVPRGDRRLLPGKVAGLFDVRRQQWLKIKHIANPEQNEKLAAREIVDGLAKGSLILGDLGYFGFRWFDDLTSAGYWWVSRLRAKTSYQVIHEYYRVGDTFDGVVYLGVHRADRAARAVRLVEFRVGELSCRYITNVLDPRVLSIKEIARLYARRWDIELGVKLVKRHLKLHLLWSSKEAVVLQQVWAVLTISQIMQALRLEIAGRAGVDVFDVSMPLLVEYLPKYGYEGEDPVEVFVKQGRELGFIRPSRRTKIRAPEISLEQIVPMPAGLDLVRTPRYAGKQTRGAKPRKTN